jgi:hypothetical protein
MLALYEQGLEFKPIHRTYIFEKMDGVSTYTKRLLVHMYQAGYLIEMSIRFYGQGPQTIRPKLLKVSTVSLIPTKAHIETLRLNVRYQDDKIKAKQLLYIIAIQINNHSKIPNPIWQSLKQYTQTLSQRSAEL